MSFIDKLITTIAGSTKARTCPGCGAELIKWEEVKVKQGFEITRIWTGCPEYKRLDDLPFTLESFKTRWDEMDRHYATWTTGTRKPLHG